MHPYLRLKVKSSLVENLLGIHNDHNQHLRLTKTQRKIVDRKINALARIIPYISQAKAKLLMKTSVTSQFSYCPLEQMCYNRQMNIRIRVYHEHRSSFRQLLKKVESITIREKNYSNTGNRNFLGKNR